MAKGVKYPHSKHEVLGKINKKVRRLLAERRVAIDEVFSHYKFYHQGVRRLKPLSDEKAYQVARQFARSQYVIAETMHKSILERLSELHQRILLQQRSEIKLTADEELLIDEKEHRANFRKADRKLQEITSFDSAYVFQNASKHAMAIVVDSVVMPLKDIRWQVFNQCQSCVRCGAQGVKFSVFENKIQTLRVTKFLTTDGVELTVDHIVPQSHGGGDDMQNLQVMCQPCNMLKGDKSQERFQQMDIERGYMWRTVAIL